MPVALAELGPSNQGVPWRLGVSASEFMSGDFGPPLCCCFDVLSVAFSEEKGSTCPFLFEADMVVTVTWSFRLDGAGVEGLKPPPCSKSRDEQKTMVRMSSGMSYKKKT